jgi:hypothetical protein
MDGNAFSVIQEVYRQQGLLNAEISVFIGRLRCGKSLFFFLTGPEFVPIQQVRPKYVRL